MNDIPPPPFKMEELDRGPSWGCIVGLFFIAWIILMILIVIILLIANRH